MKFYADVGLGELLPCRLMVPSVHCGQNSGENFLFEDCCQGYKYLIFTARSSYTSAFLGIVTLPVCPSVTRVLCDETIEHTDDILIPHERVIILVF